MDLEAYKYSDEEIYEGWLSGRSEEDLVRLTNIRKSEIILIIKKQAELQNKTETKT